MKLLYKTSLVKTVNAVNETLFFEKKYPYAGMNILKANRDGKGKWGRFPFFYTVLRKEFKVII